MGWSRTGAAPDQALEPDGWSPAVLVVLAIVAAVGAFMSSMATGDSPSYRWRGSRRAVSGADGAGRATTADNSCWGGKPYESCVDGRRARDASAAFTTTIPKPLVPVGGELPIIELLLRQLRRCGVTEVTLATPGTWVD